MLHNDEVEKLCSSNNLLEVKYSQGFINGLNAYTELDFALDQYKLQTEADKARLENFKQATSVTSQAEAMGII